MLMPDWITGLHRKERGMRIGKWFVGGGVVVAVASAYLMAQSTPPRVTSDVSEVAVARPLVMAQAAPVQRGKSIPQSRAVNALPIVLDPPSDAPIFGDLPPSVLPLPEIDMPPHTTTVEAPVDAAEVDPAPLRRELRSLLDEKLGLLTVPQLQAAIDRTEREIREIRAQDRLQELRHELDRLSREYPHTWGGDTAQQLFNVPLSMPNVPGTHPFESLPPRLDPGFGSASGPIYAPTYAPSQSAPVNIRAPQSFVPTSPAPTVRRKAS
jgi:hypothetical protein